MQLKENIISKQDLFHFHLVESPDSLNALERIRGNSESELLLVVSENQQPSDALLALLANILNAVGIDTLDAAQLLMITASDKFGSASLLRHRNIKRCIVFGASPEQMQLNIAWLKYHGFEMGGISFLFSDALSEIQHNVKLKKELWNALQSFFKK